MLSKNWTMKFDLFSCIANFLYSLKEVKINSSLPCHPLSQAGQTTGSNYLRYSMNLNIPSQVKPCNPTQYYKDNTIELTSTVTYIASAWLSRLQNIKCQLYRLRKGPKIQIYSLLLSCITINNTPSTARLLNTKIRDWMRHVIFK